MLNQAFVKLFCEINHFKVFVFVSKKEIINVPMKPANSRKLPVNHGRYILEVETP